MTLPPAVTLSEHVRTFLDQALCPSLATSGADGEPHQAVIWYGLEADGRILVNSNAGRRWPADLVRDGRASLAVTDPADPFRWVGLQAVVETVIDDVHVAREDIVALAMRYGGASPDTLARFRSQNRISFRLRIVAVHDHLED